MVDIIKNVFESVLGRKVIEEIIKSFKEDEKLE